MNNVTEVSQENYFELYEKERKLRTSMHKLTHEIKNPLAVCNGYLEMMMEKDDISKEKYLEIVRDEIKRTLSVINDFSFFSKEKKLELEELDLTLLLEDIIKTIHPLLENRNGKIIMISEDENYLIGDYKRLKQAFINIIKNSIEASQTNIKITCSVKKHKNHYLIKIKDNGCGMTKEELENIFDEYYTTKQHGTGLGVPYVKEIFDLHGGVIKYKSEKRRGTTAIIVLPKEKSPKTFNNNSY